MADEESTTKKSTTKKTTTRKTPAKRSAAKKTTGKKTTTRKSSADDGGSQQSASMSSEPSRRSTASRVIAEVSRQFTEMSSKQVEGVTGLERTDDGWTVELDVLELRRVPATTDVLARYEVSADSSGEVEGYRRLQRYVRGQAEGSS